MARLWKIFFAFLICAATTRSQHGGGFGGGMHSFIEKTQREPVFRGVGGPSFNAMVSRHVREIGPAKNVHTYGSFEELSRHAREYDQKIIQLLSRRGREIKLEMAPSHKNRLQTGPSRHRREVDQNIIRKPKQPNQGLQTELSRQRREVDKEMIDPPQLDPAPVGLTKELPRQRREIDQEMVRWTKKGLPTELSRPGRAISQEMIRGPKTMGMFPQRPPNHGLQTELSRQRREISQEIIRGPKTKGMFPQRPHNHGLQTEPSRQRREISQEMIALLPPGRRGMSRQRRETNRTPVYMGLLAFLAAPPRHGGKFAPGMIDPPSSGLRKELVRGRREIDQESVHLPPDF